MMKYIVTIFFILAALVSGCNSGNNGSTLATTPFTLKFKVKSGDQVVNCNDSYKGFGSDGNKSIGIGDLRFFVSNIRFYDAVGKSIKLQLDVNSFQYSSKEGNVALIDFFGNESDYCATIAEATSRINTQITGAVSDSEVSRIRFDIGVPQTLMKTMITAGPVEDAPSPLNELYWSWAGGYRHFVINFTALDVDHREMVNNGAFHIGSMDCGGDMSTGAKALKARDKCGRLNTPTVSLDNFNPSTNTIVVDINEVFRGIQAVDIKRAIWQKHKGNETICINDKRKGGACIAGEIFGIQCHSRTAQPACQSLFPNFGIDITSGESQSATNTVFTME